MILRVHIIHIASVLWPIMSSKSNSLSVISLKPPRHNLTITPFSPRVDLMQKQTSGLSFCIIKLMIHAIASSSLDGSVVLSSIFCMFSSFFEASYSSASAV